MENPVFTFDTFVISEGSRVAWEACIAMAEAAEDASNPLFLLGPVGSGKSHLLHAIASRRRSLHPHAHVQRLAAADYVSDLVVAVRNRDLAAWQQSLNKVDLLLLDDLRLSDDTPHTEDEVFRQLTDLTKAGVQVVVACDARHEAALRTRLSSGFLQKAEVVTLAHPDRDARLEIVRRAARSRGLTLSERTIRELAEASDGSPRRLQGIVARLAAEAALE